MLHNMNNGLQIYQQTQLQTVQAQNSYALALTSTRQMIELTTDQKHNFLLDCIHKATFIGGWHNKADHEMLLLIDILLPDFEKRYKLMTELEVKTAFENGAKGNYGDTPGLSVAGCLKWLNAYYLDQERQRAKKLIEKSKEQPRPKLTRGEKRAFINAAFAKYCEDGFYKDYGNAVYNLVDNECLITFTNVQKREFLERGRKIVFDQLQNYKNIDQKRENDKKIEDLMDNDKPAVGEAKRIALFEYFKILKDQKFTEVPFLNSCPKI